jgi:predicted transposase YdaD
MTTKVDFPMLKFEFPLISLASVDYSLFLNSNKPEEIILSILADFNDISSDFVLKQIIYHLEETTQSDLSLKKYFKQLRILAQLRKLEQNLKDIVMESIAKYIDEERDVAFLVGLDKGEIKGELKGELKAEERFVKNLLVKMALTLEQIADIAGVSVDFVKQVKQKIAANS